jgi:iron complex transport system ATP-binding protein
VSEVTIRVEEVTVRRDGATLLDAVSHEARSGEVVAIVGPNGAGKTTLLRVIAGDLAPDTGTATVAGVDSTRTPLQEMARHRAYLGAAGAEGNPFRVWDVVAMGRHPHRGHERDDGAIVAAALRRFDVDHLARRRVRTLSTGEQQRVGLARVVAQETPILLLDEPTAALDIGHQEMVMGVLRELATAGITVLTVIHDLNLAAAHADRMVLLDDGRSVAVGSPRDVLVAARLSAIYRQPMQVIDHPFRDCPLVLSTSGDGLAQPSSALSANTVITPE